MSKNTEKIKLECGRRLHEWLTEIHMTQTCLGELIEYSTVHISNVIRGKKELSIKMARLISEKTPQINENGQKYYIVPEYLTCDIDIRTSTELNQLCFDIHNPSVTNETIIECADMLIDHIIFKTTYDKWVHQELDSKQIEHFTIPEVPQSDRQFMQELIINYANQLVHSRLFYPENDSFWRHINAIQNEKKTKK